ncbi:MAG: radical SAM protein [Bacteroidales bacterium]|nr:radical SAM protein [Bacteroidales bacterium]
MEEYGYYTDEERLLLEKCTICPRECGVNRFEGGNGWCGMDAGMNIASICIHRGEEPPISGPQGICNIFFRGCNLSCTFCQNHEISRSVGISGRSRLPLADILGQIVRILDKGIRAVGFVSPSHAVPQVRAIIRGLNALGRKPVTVYNTNSYDKPARLRELDGLIDVYLPDYKYVTPEKALEYSGSSDYPEKALRAIREMYFQKGSTLRIDDHGTAENGILIRHLVLPGHVEESRRVLRSIAEEISTGISVSLMSQYCPVPETRDHPLLNRPLSASEYQAVVREMEDLGFRNGWVQDMASHRNYRPDFRRKNPFT